MLNFQNTPIEGRLENLDMFHSLGVRTMQLTYNERNEIGDGSTERTNAGVSSAPPPVDVIPTITPTMSPTRASESDMRPSVSSEASTSGSAGPRQTSLNRT